jgi:hypothetical protein
MYASFLGISEALHMDIFHQPPGNWFFDSLIINLLLTILKPSSDLGIIVSQGSAVQCLGHLDLDHLILL